MLDVSGAFKAFIQTYAGMKPDEEKLALMEIRHQVMQLEDENGDLKREVKSLREKLAGRKKLECFGGAYFVLDDGGARTGPVCPKCYNGEGIVSLLARSSVGSRCYVCKSEYPGIRSDIEGDGDFVGF